MHLLKEVLRLTATGLSQRQIARSLKLSNGVVAKYHAASRRAGLSWPLPETLDDATADPAYRGCFTAQHVNDFVQRQESVVHRVGMNNQEVRQRGHLS